MQSHITKVIKTAHLKKGKYPGKPKSTQREKKQTNKQTAGNAGKLKRGKARATKARLVLVLHLIG